jgi:hypothetical protein
MPANKVNCPLCNDEVNDTRLGSHLLSKKHLPVLQQRNTTLKRFLQGLIDNKPYLNGKNEPPIVVIREAKGEKEELAYHICLHCTKCYKVHNDGALTGANTHYEKYPACKAKVIDNLKAFFAVKEDKTTPVVSAEDKDKISMLEAKILKLQRELDMAYDGQQSSIDECGAYHNVMKKLFGTDYSIERINDILADHEAQGIEPLYKSYL